MPKQPYVIAGESFEKKDQITDRCRQILYAEAVGTPIAAQSDITFLRALFTEWHDEWDEKTAGGFIGFSTKTVYALGKPTQCFVILTADGDTIDISFPHAIRLIKTARSDSLIPQGLRDFRNAARVAIAPQTTAFRKRALTGSATCPLTSETLTEQNCAVDHHEPTFDQLLFEFCRTNNIDPTLEPVGSINGVRAALDNKVVESKWQSFHQERAKLRLVERTQNLKLLKPPVPWQEVIL